MSNSKILPLTETAIAAAVAFALSFLTINIAETFYLEFAVIPIILLSLRRGVRWGLAAGLIFSLLLFVTGRVSALPLNSMPSFLTSIFAAFPKDLRLPILQYSDGILEYFIAPISLAVAGFFKSHHLTATKVALAAVVASLVKYFFHFIAGGIFWGSYAPKGWNPWLFSFATQGLSGILTAIVAAIILVILYKSIPKLLN